MNKERLSSRAARASERDQTPPLASLRRRFASLLYESLVVFALLLIGFWLPQAFLAGFLAGQGIIIGGKLLVLHIFLMLMVYFVWFWLNGGQTLPMKTWKLRLASADGGPLRPAQALFRYLAAWPSILLGGCGLLWALVDKDRQFLHDRLAGTCIQIKEN